MCGIAAIFSKSKINLKNEEDLNVMLHALKFRGPDSLNTEKIDDNLILGHTRLAILGDEKSARQPMVSLDQRFSIVFNGEIYNFRRLAKKYRINSNGSDTRLFIELISKIGFNSALEEIDGMYAVVLFDKDQGVLTFASDNYCQKPLYYSEYNGALYIASELSSFKSFGFNVDSRSCDMFLQFGHVPVPYTLFENVSKVEPDTRYTYSINGGLSRSYIPRTRGESSTDNNRGWRDIIDDYLVSDVPVCIFQSSGYDSSLIMSALSGRRDVTALTFSSGKRNSDEGTQAKKISEFFKIPHVNVEVSDIEVSSFLENISIHFSEPIADAAGLALLLLVREAKSRGFKVALSGDGGDEVYGGYEHIERKYERVYSKSFKNDIFSGILKYPIPSKIGREIKKYFTSFSSNIVSPLDMYHTTSSGDYYGYTNSESRDKYYINNFDTFLSNNFEEYNKKFLLASRFCPKIDRPSASLGFEIRTPFLSTRLGFVSGGRQAKYDQLRSLMPESLLVREKKGFVFDIAGILASSGASWLDSMNNVSHRYSSYLNVGKFRTECNLFKIGLGDVEYIYRAALLISWFEEYI